MIDWTDEAIEAALHEYCSGNRTAAQDTRAALDAAVKAQAMTTEDWMSGIGYCRGYNDALEDAEKMVTRMYPEADDLLDAIRALKGETP